MCNVVEKVLREREEGRECGGKIEKKECEIQRAQKKGEREAGELGEAKGWHRCNFPFRKRPLPFVETVVLFCNE